MPPQWTTGPGTFNPPRSLRALGGAASRAGFGSRRSSPHLMVVDGVEDRPRSNINEYTTMDHMHVIDVSMEYSIVCRGRPSGRSSGRPMCERTGGLIAGSVFARA